jgi:uncharacterized protein YxjI
MSNSPILALFAAFDALYVRQRKELVEILVDWETRNQYAVMDESGRELGTVYERGGGVLDFFKRGFLRSHRGFEADFVALHREVFLHLRRNFFLFFSDLDVSDAFGRVLGRVRRRFSVFYKRYDLEDGEGRVFARIRSPFWRLWTFPIVDAAGAQRGVITKKWGGGLREIFSDADTFRIEFASFSEHEKAVIFAAAISIDFDFFENNQGVSGVLGGVLDD